MAIIGNCVQLTVNQRGDYRASAQQCALWRIEAYFNLGIERITPCFAHKVQRLGFVEVVVSPNGVVAVAYVGKIFHRDVVGRATAAHGEVAAEPLRFRP